MLLWFVGCSVAIVWFVFRSAGLDYRMVVVGVLLPMIEIPVGPAALHSLAGAVLALAVVMLATRHRRLVRRRWMGIPIGMFLHLVLDGSFTRTDVFWWPFTGWDFAPGPVPELDRALPFVLVLEVAGALVCLWCYRTFGLEDPARRRAMIRTGHVDRSLLPPAEG